MVWGLLFKISHDARCCTFQLDGDPQLRNRVSWWQNIMVKRQPGKIPSYPSYPFPSVLDLPIEQQVLHENVPFSFSLPFDARK